MGTQEWRSEPNHAENARDERILIYKGNVVVAEVVHQWMEWDEYEAHAELIVRAVNCHEDLLAALELANELLDNSDVRHYIGHDLGEMSQLHRALNTARAALAKAKEGL